MGHEITSSCVQGVCVCVWRGLLAQSIKAVWDSHRDALGLRSERHTSKALPLKY